MASAAWSVLPNVSHSLSIKTFKTSSGCNLIAFDLLLFDVPYFPGMFMMMNETHKGGKTNINSLTVWMELPVINCFIGFLKSLHIHTHFCIKWYLWPTYWTDKMYENTCSGTENDNSLACSHAKTIPTLWVWLKYQDLATDSRSEIIVRMQQTGRRLAQLVGPE